MSAPNIGERIDIPSSMTSSVFWARAITDMGKVSGEAGLKGGRGVWLDSETP